MTDEARVSVNFIRTINERHKDDPKFKARKYGYKVVFRARQKARRLCGEHTLWLMGGCVKVNMGRAA